MHYDDGAVSHLFQVAAGLDSMAVGEAQILGQTREALRLGQELGTVGPALNLLFQQALRVGKRSRAETGIDQVAPSLVSAALERSVEAAVPWPASGSWSSVPAAWPGSPPPPSPGSVPPRWWWSTAAPSAPPASPPRRRPGRQPR